MNRKIDATQIQKKMSPAKCLIDDRMLEPRSFQAV